MFHPCNDKHFQLSVDAKNESSDNLLLTGVVNEALLVMHTTCDGTIPRKWVASHSILFSGKHFKECPRASKARG